MTLASDLDTIDLTSAGDELAALVQGPVLRPDHPEFVSEIAGFNLAHARRPDIVVGATSADDVAAAIRWARTHGLRIAVQSTGHGLAPSTPGGVLVTTRRMSTVAIDPAAQTARAGAGVRWSQVIDAAAPHGLAPLSGSSSQVGVVGYTLGGGLGPLGRRFGFAADHVLRLQLVTADGEIREVDATTDPELFWAIRGGKGNFGIVTDIEFSLFPVAHFYGGGIFYPIADAPVVLRAWRDWTANLSDRTTSSVALLQLPPDPMLPEPLRGQRVVHLRVVHLGPAAEGADLLAPMREVASPLLDGVADIPFAAVDSVHMDPISPMPTWEQGCTLRELTAESIDAVLSQAGGDVPTPLVIVELRHLGGALARPAAVPNAIAGRDASFSLFTVGVLAGPAVDVVPAAARSLLDALRPWSTGGSLLNFRGPASPTEVGALWSDTDRARLLAVKHRLDPAGVFAPGQVIG